MIPSEVANGSYITPWAHCVPHDIDGRSSDDCSDRSITCLLPLKASTLVAICPILGEKMREATKKMTSTVVSIQLAFRS